MSGAIRTHATALGFFAIAFDGLGSLGVLSGRGTSDGRVGAEMLSPHAPAGLRKAFAMLPPSLHVLKNITMLHYKRRSSRGLELLFLF